MEASTNTFHYRPLGQDKPDIRLVSLLPASNPSAEIHCELLYISLDEPVSYEPLSYAWGDPVITEPIFLDGHKFAITTNLYSALKHLCLADQPRTLWVDSICIDQLNITERSYQVQRSGPFTKMPQGPWFGWVKREMLAKQSLSSSKSIILCGDRVNSAIWLWIDLAPLVFVDSGVNKGRRRKQSGRSLSICQKICARLLGRWIDAQTYSKDPGSNVAG
jgi:hypothetical protein